MGIKKYFSFIKFIHTLFAMPFMLVGFTYGVAEQGYFSAHLWKILGLCVLCMVFARSAAMGFNRYADRKIDKLNPRTAQREIPSGVINRQNALIFIIINSLLFILATYFINPICFYLSPIALIWVLGYSYAKRFTFLSHLILGTGLAIAPVGAYLAVSGSFNVVICYLSMITLFWTAGFDIHYALQDEQFDKQHGLHSIPSVFGSRKAAIFSACFHLIAACMVIIFGLHIKTGYLYWIGAGCFIGLLIFQHIIMHSGKSVKIEIAFFSSNSTASILFAVFSIFNFVKEYIYQ